MDSLNTRMKDAIHNGTKEAIGKRKQTQSKYFWSPDQWNGRSKCVRKSLFGIGDVMISTDHITQRPRRLSIVI
ncbi:hypothetical protein D1007_51132 [Hordeum vulgare]|nr:hypothetical protein D1007_51132 [Hordeum vulgare]